MLEYDFIISTYKSNHFMYLKKFYFEDMPKCSKYNSDLQILSQYKLKLR